MSDRTGDTERSADETPSVDPETLADRLRSGAGDGESRSRPRPLTVLDVRDRDEFERWHLEGDGLEAVQIPHMRFVQAEATGRVADLVDDHDLVEPILAVCGRGEASAHAVSLLREAGFEARNLAGGMDAWAELYLVRELDVGGSTTVSVLQYDRPSSGCLAYAVVSGGEAAVIDPLRTFANRYVEDLDDRGVEMRYAIDTHVHADHVSGVRDLAARTDAEAVVPAGARDRGLAFDATTVADGDELQVGDATLSVLATPGHTRESLSFRLERGASGDTDGDGDAGTATLFTGDTLFLEGVGRPDLEGGRDEAPAAARRLYETLRDRVLALPDDTTIAPGHYGDADPREDGSYVATLETLRDRLTALSMDEAAFVSHVTDDLPPRPNNDERIVRVNLGLEDVDEGTAFELESGPNNCAVAE
ncbi:MBL fold metallo-hydrolase [Halomontanus rarus]|uniref:MBL fold metallo-hydrolase n=1 Tax=Halomontanus rarus TaxID=3034020 RepID=UPI001A986309